MLRVVLVVVAVSLLLLCCVVVVWCCLTCCLFGVPVWLLVLAGVVNLQVCFFFLFFSVGFVVFVGVT